MIEFPKRGEIYLVNLPSKQKDFKNRPALIISLDIRNKLANDVIVIPLSTTLKQSPTHVLLESGEGGLTKNSMAKCEQVTTLDKEFLIKGPFDGKITHQKILEIENSIMIAIGII